MESGLHTIDGNNVWSLDVSGSKGSDTNNDVDQQAFGRDSFEWAQGHALAMNGNGMAAGLAAPTGGVGFGHH
jgi:hypothetical protein